MSANSVLVVDDDTNFRSIVSAILKSRGLNVVEARTAREATAKLGSLNPILALVDYRLPEMDGIAWISQVREMDKNFPIVFISGSWCDPKTFNRLRNLLKVTLILQKPIVPELFIQQIESLLPANLALRAAPMVEATEANLDELPEAAQTAGGAEENAAAGSGDSLDALRQLRSKREREQNLAGIQAQYAGELTEKWNELSQAVGQVRQNLDDRSALNDAINLAHKVRGTAGTVGFKQCGDAAGKIEDLLNRLDPTDTLAEIIWTEVFRFLADGETAIRDAINSMREAKSPGQEAGAKKILLWGREKKYSVFAAGLKTDPPIEIDIVESLAVAQQKAQRNKYHAAIFDLSMGHEHHMLSVAAQLREYPEHRSLPLACVIPQSTTLKQKDIAYAGVSLVLPEDVSQNDFTETCKILLTLGQTSNARILTVDDDQVLTQFISTILSAEEMTVRALNKPIIIMDIVEHFKPDLVLLDVMMPGLSGFDVCRMLRSDPRTKDTAIIFLTSKSDQDGRAAAFQAGGDDFLGKPVLAEELITRVKSQLHQAQLRKGPEAIDQLTGALTGTEFMNRAKDLISRSQGEEVPVSICLLNVDEFTQISLNHGMLAARDASLALNKLLHQHFKAEDLRGKLGEESFALAFFNEDQDTVGKAIEDLLYDYSDILIASDTTSNFKATFSAGVAQYPQDGTTVAQLLNVANRRLLSGRESRLGAISYATVT